jgi:hypothetical protein
VCVHICKFAASQVAHALMYMSMCVHMCKFVATQVAHALMYMSMCVHICKFVASPTAQGSFVAGLQSWTSIAARQTNPWSGDRQTYMVRRQTDNGFRQTG